MGDLASRPDTFPCLAMLAALRRGRTEFDDLPALRHKESDRIHAMAEALTALGVTCEERTHGLAVEGPLPEPRGPVALKTPPDHRVVMALALLGTKLPFGVVVEHGDAVEKSWPDFFAWLGRVAEVTVL